MARSSTFHPMQFEMKSMEPRQLSEAKQFLEENFSHTHIRYPLSIEKSEEFLSNEKILLIPNEGRADPGFLCFLPRKPVQFLKCRLDTGFYVRLRVDSSLFQNGTVFISTVHLNTVTIQDCWMWQGESLLSLPFSKRFAYVQKFLRTYVIQDPRISGFEVQQAQLFALDSFQSLLESQEYASIDFVPEATKRRRFFYRTDNQQQKPKPQEHKQHQQHSTSVESSVPVQSKKPFVGPLIAFAKNIQGLPDTFDLFSADKKHIGEAAIQEEEISTQLRLEHQKRPSFPVVVEWNRFLDAFEIKKVAPQGSRVLFYSNFTQVSGTQKPTPVEQQPESHELSDSDE